MAYEKQKKLVTMMLDKTKRGDLEWTEAFRDGLFQVAFSDISVRIHAQEGEYETVDYSIEVLNGEGNVVDSITDDELISAKTDTETVSWYAVMQELYATARRTALGTEAVLDELIGRLEAVPRKTK
jgi:hypothetical protein